MSQGWECADHKGGYTTLLLVDSCTDFLTFALSCLFCYTRGFSSLLCAAGRFLLELGGNNAIVGEH